MTMADLEAALSSPPEDVPFAAADGCPVQPLGHNAGRFYFIDTAAQVREMTQSAFTINGVMDIFGGRMAWAEDNFADAAKSRSDKTSWNNVALTRALMRACYAAGFFDPDKDLRGPGVWLPVAGDGGMVVHSGDRLHIFAADGSFLEVLAAGRRIGRHVYAATAPEAGPATVSAEKDVAAAMLVFLQTFSFARQSIDPEMFLGHVALGFVPGALRYRPAAWSIGQKGSGKSALLDIAKAAIGDGMNKYDKSTEPGVRHEIKKIWAARAIGLDEIEADENNQATQRLVEMARLAYDREARTVIGGPDGGVTKINAIFYFASIEPPPVKEQDASRTVVYELRPLYVQAAAVEAFDSEIDKIHAAGPALRRRFYEGWPRFLAIQAQVRHEIVQSGLEPRFANTFAPIVAAATVMLTDAGELTADDLARWMKHLRFRADREEGLSNAEECLRHLLTKPGPGVWRGGERKHVGKEVAKAFGRDATGQAMAVEDMIEPADYSSGDKDKWFPDRDSLNLIRDWGLSIIEADGLRYLAVANDHAGLEEIFQGKRWAGRGWMRPLRQLSYARASTNAIRFGPIRSRATLIPEEIVLGRIGD